MKKKKIITKLMVFCLAGTMTLTHTAPVIAFANEKNNNYEYNVEQCELSDPELHIIKTFATLNVAAKYFIGAPVAQRAGTMTWQTATKAIEFIQQRDGLWTAKTAAQTFRDLTILNPWG